MTRLQPRLLGPLAVALCAVAGLAGCPDNLAQLCPADTKAEGVFDMSLTLRTGRSDECRVKDADGGVTDAGVFGNPSAITAAICSKQLGDGGVQVTLALARTVRPTDTDGDGGFQFQSTSEIAIAACSNCTFRVAETIDGILLPASGGDAGAKYGDGGFEPLRGFAGVVSDQVDGGHLEDGGTDCRCTDPCTAVFDMTATKQ